MMRYFFYLLFSMIIFTLSLCVTTADELMHIHKVTTAEMNAINSPQSGSLAYNTSENSLYFYTGTHWKKMRSKGNETSINAGSGISITGDGEPSTPYTVGI